MLQSGSLEFHHHKLSPPWDERFLITKFPEEIVTLPKRRLNLDVSSSARYTKNLILYWLGDGC